ncbi:MAG: diaminopimelate decarboxylase [Planctomycetes bacterium]|nr:diaminopimelate decarboxylase [Planctomycetota bacterium]
MDYFYYCKEELYCEDVPVSRIAEQVGTPAYIYSSRTVQEHFHKLKKAFSAPGRAPLICYSLKANSNLAICRLLKSAGAGFDVVSGGELFRTLSIGADPAKIVFAGVGKSIAEIKYALQNNILMFNTESFQEILNINLVAQRLNKTARISMRINPDVEPHTHKYLTTAKEETKFGFTIPDAYKIINMLNRFQRVKLVGLHTHIGSQILQITPYLKALKKVLPMIDECRRLGHPVEYLDIGGGFGIYYRGEEAKPAAKFARAILPLVRKAGCRLIMEPGRFIVGNAGILVTKVIAVKETNRKCFVICDAGMNTLIRPSLYDAYHRIEPVRKMKDERIKMRADVVGPVCESGDFLGKDRQLPPVKAGDYLSVFSAGAYGYSMVSNYNSRPRPAEVLVSGNRYKVTTRAERYDDLIRLENK